MPHAPRTRVWNRLRNRPVLEPMEDRRLLATFFVTSFGDDGAGSGNSGDLRYAITQANALKGSAIDRIDFSLLQLTPGSHTIRVGAGAAGRVPLPAITDPVEIIGSTAQGYSFRDGLMLQVDGSALKGSANGLVLKAGNSTVQALQITDFPGHGILITSPNNLIGGDTVGTTLGTPPNGGAPNNPAGKITSPPSQAGPTPRVIVRPPDGNVIGGNGGDGIRISGKSARNNLLEGNFIGTDIKGTTADPNGGNGVTILNADNNSLLGTIPPDKGNPFIFYNVISGNRGHGLAVTNSDNTTIYANFFGLGADDQTPLGNGGNGVLINGDSTGTLFGGNIPLGNVTAANGKHGVEIADHASRTFAGNTFAGIAAFNPAASVGNRGDGFRITSDGGGKRFGKADFSTLILTCQVADNAGNGINITGKAKGVRISQCVIGLDTDGLAAEPNGKDGIAISGKASTVGIGGFAPSVAGFPPTGKFDEAAAVISGNRGNGISVVGHGVKDVRIVNAYIGTDLLRTSPVGNGKDGIYINGVDDVRIGSTPGANVPKDAVTVAFNAGNGIEVQDAEGVRILGSPIYSNGLRGILLGKHANDGQAAPVLTLAGGDPAGLTLVKGTLSGEGNTTYQVEVYSGPNAVGGSGRTFLGLVKVRTDHKGNASFKLAGLNVPPDDNFLVATATSSEGNTSPFSRALPLS